MLSEFRHALSGFFFRRRADRVLDSELQFHIEREIQENQRKGMTHDEARRKAVAEFGGVSLIQEECRDAFGTRIADNFRRDVSYAVRSLSKNPGYTLVAVLTLALGIGANTALFSVINGTLLRPLPFRDGNRIVVLQNYDSLAGRNSLGFSYLEMEQMRSQPKTLESVVEFHSMRFTLLGRAEPEVVDTGVVSADYFEFFGIQPLYGRVFLPGEDKHEAAPVLLLSYRYFQNGFGGDPKVVGQTVRLNDRVHTIIGVLPPLPEYPSKIDVFMPTSSCPTRSSDQFRGNRRARLLTLFGRRKPGVSVEQVNAELMGISRQIRSANQDVYPRHEQWGTRQVNLRDELTEKAGPTFWLLFASTGLVLLIACANVANMTLARALKREREMAIRTALGGSRGRLFQQLIVEGLVVSLAGGVLGLLMADQTLRLLISFAGRFTLRAHEITLDWPVLAFSLALSVLAGVVFCALPAWRTPPDLAASCKEGSAGSTVSTSRVRLRGMLVTAQVAFSFVLLIAAGLLLRSFLKLTQVEMGFRPERVLSMSVPANWSRITTAEQFRALFERLLEKVRTIPGVQSAAVCARVPLNQRLPLNRNFRIEKEDPRDGAPQPLVDLSSISPGYFETLSVPVQRGRDFSESDRNGAPLVAIINESMAKHRWPNQDPVGRRLSLDNGERWISIVGVARDMRFYGADREVTDQVYLPFAQNPLGINVVVRTTIDPRQLMKQMREAVYSIDREQAIAEIRTLEEIVQESYASPRLTALLLGLFAGLTLLITVAGISGVAALAVSRRQTEIGIRLALGARPWQIIGQMVRQEMGMVVLGLGIGVAGALALTRLLATFLFGVGANDELTYVAAVLVLLIVSAGACFLPARRAVGIDPMLSLRSE